MWTSISIFTVLVVSVSAANKPFINFGGFVCPREEKALGRCIKDALNSYIPKLGAGIPEFAVPPCEPLLVPAITIQQSSGALAVTSAYTDVTVRGPSTMKVLDLQVDTAKKTIEAKLSIPELRMDGNYRMSGQLLMLPVEGDGEFTATYSNIAANVSITLGRLKREGRQDALSCDSLGVKFSVGHATMDMRNLFGGDSDLGGAMNKFINENWQQLAEELQAPLEEALQAFLKPLADHAFATLNADDILT